VSQAIDALLKRKFVTATADINDRRSMHYTITSDAEAVIEDIAAKKKEMDEQILKGISKKEVETYKKISEKMIKNIRDML
jgi:DNA-binding MarR family transcriptional regulator